MAFCQVTIWVLEYIVMVGRLGAPRLIQGRERVRRHLCQRNRRCTTRWLKVVLLFAFGGNGGGVGVRGNRADKEIICARLGMSGWLSGCVTIICTLI